MKKTSESNFFHLWEQSQKHLWDSLSTISNPFEFPKQLGFFNNPAFQMLSTWGEAAINQSLEMQLSWLDRWAQRMNEASIDPDLFDESIDQINNSMSKWTITQKGLWDNWFRVLEASTALPGINDHQKAILDSWKKTVDRSLSEQNDWLSIWSDQIAYKQLSAKGRLHFTQQLREAMEGWIDNQQALWGYWFAFLNGKEGLAHTIGAPELKNNTIVYSPIFKDDLKQITGIGPRLEEKLNQQGIVNFRQIADLDNDDIDTLEENIGFPGRIKRDNWVTQARKLLDSSR